MLFAYIEIEAANTCHLEVAKLLDAIRREPATRLLGLGPQLLRSIPDELVRMAACYKHGMDASLEM